MEMLSEFIKIINYAGIVQGLFLAFVLFNGKNKNTKADHILGVLIALLSINIIHSLFLANHFYSPLKFREPFITLLCPFLYFYALEINQNFAVKFSIIKHFVLFTVFFMFQAFLNFDFFHRFAYFHEKLFSLAIIFLMLLQFSYYIFLITRTTRIYHKKIENEFSHTDELDIEWIKSFLVVFILIYVVLFIALFFLVHLDFFTDYNKIIAFIFAVSIYILGYKGVKQQTIPKPIEADELANGDNVNNTTRKEGQTVQEADNEVPEKLIEKIRIYMKERKPYLDPDITLSEMANELEIGRNALSFAINKGFKQNFFSFINKYRVEEVITFLDDPEKENQNFLRLGYDAGFNSKATFNHIFKKYTGFTPKEYKLRLQRTKSDV
jgi:AraC-like DNA-binding protein/NADH:ubiquinone oxidoreductase subunit 6 (subunit J)